MHRLYSYRIKGQTSQRKLAVLASKVNFVWNFCNDTQRLAVMRRQRWPSGYDFNNLTSGSCKDLGLAAESIQAIGQKYAKGRDTSRKRSLRYRGGKSLGWVPFKAQGIKQIKDSFRFMGHTYRVWLSRPVPGPILCGSFSQDSGGNWFINVCVKMAADTSCGDGQVGIDLGLKTVATMSNGDKYDGARAYKSIERKLAIAQRAKKRRRCSALNRKAKNRRRDGLHKLSTRLVSENKLVAVGDVSIAKLAKTRMAKSVHDAGWGMLRAMLRYKTIARGAAYRDVDEYNSSQICSSCGTLPNSRPKGIACLRIREWVCSHCGQGHDRDINAARNILALGCERPAEGTPAPVEPGGINACQTGQRSTAARTGKRTPW